MQPLSLVLIGGTGDLARKKILRSLYELHSQKLLPQDFILMGSSRKQLTDESYREFIYELVKPKDWDAWTAFSQIIYYTAGDATQAELMKLITKRLTELENTEHRNRLLYVATLPQLYFDVVNSIKTSGLGQSNNGWAKIMLEKPFGTDLQTSQALNTALLEIFPEEHIYRIDHYLGMETVQNALAFRFGNGMFEYLWSNQYIDHIQLTWLEQYGVEGREGFFDATGIIRDVLQNHLLQMLAVTLMSEPKSLKAEAIRESRTQLIESLHLSGKVAEAVRFGQFSDYQSSHPQLALSKTETAVALKLESTLPQWSGVPIYVRAGKKFGNDALPKVTEINIVFKEPRNSMFQQLKQQPDRLTLRIQPNEGIILYLSAKKPGLDFQLETVSLDFCYRNQFSMDLISAYERLIHDAINSDSTLFPHASGIESSWRLVQPLLDHMAQPDFQPESYTPLTWGPTSFNHLLESDNRHWFEPDPLMCRI